MKVDVQPATAADRARLDALIQLYAYDFSEILGMDVDEAGRFDPPRIDSACQTFLVRIGGRLAGFAVVRQPGAWDVAEFFVMRKYRRHGVGAQVAKWLFDRFRGPWQVREKAENRAAIAFWRRVIRDYTGGRFTEEVLDDEGWRGPVQRFDSGAGR